MKLDDRFRSLDRTSIPEVWTEATSRATHQNDLSADLIEIRRRRIPKVVAAVLFVGVFLWGFIGLERSLKHGSQTSEFAPGQIARYPIPDAQPLAYGGGWTWVSGSAGDSTEIYRIDAVTGTTTPLPETRGAVWVTFGAGYAWALCYVETNSPCTGPILMKMDPATGRVIDRIPLPAAAFSVVTGFGAVWVATLDGILRIDPNSDQIIQTFSGITAVAHVDVGGGLVWGSSLQKRKIVGLDPTSGAVVASVPFADPCMVTAGSEGVYVASCGGLGPPITHRDQLMRIDPTTGRVDFTVPLPSNASGFITLFEGRLWIGAWTNDHAELIPLDPASGQPTGEAVELPASTQGFASTGPGQLGLFLAGGADSLWVTHVDANDVIRIGVAGTPTSSSIDPTVSAELAVRGITVSSVSDASAVSATSAVTAAGVNFGFIGWVTPTASLVRFTDLDTGPHADHGKPLYSNTEAWAVVYRGIQMPFLGGPIGTTLPATHPADFVVFVDAHTGQYLTAVSIGT
jgi:hypothetical protein